MLQLEETTIEGLDAGTVESMREVYENNTYTFLTRNDLARHIEVEKDEFNVEITAEHVAEFNRQLATGLRCQNCGAHWTQSRLSTVPNVLCENKCLELD